MDPIPIDALERDWRCGLTGARLEKRFRAWAECEPALASLAGPAACLRFLRTGTEDERDAVLRALLTRAQEEPLAGQLVAEALLPGLKRLAGKLLIDASEREERWAILLACAWEAIRRYPLKRRPERIAANLLLDTLRAALRELRSQQRSELELPERLLERGHGGAEGEGDVEALLGHAVAAGAISDVEAELILATRVDGRPLRALAGEEGVTYNTIKVRRQRAERRLLLFLGYPPVPRGAQRRRISTAWVFGAASAGDAGRDDLTRTRRR